jgi:hypothetical protein
MAHPTAKLYQRLRTKGFPWVLCEIAKNGSPKPDGAAFQFGVRYSLTGKRRLDTAATVDEASALLKDRNVRLYAKQNGVTLPDAHGGGSAPRLTLAEAVEHYFIDKAAESKDHKTISAYRRGGRNTYYPFMSSSGCWVTSPLRPRKYTWLTQT